MSRDTKRRARQAGRSSEVGGFAGVPRSVMDTRKYRALSAPAKVLLFELCRQFRGFNNGDLCTAWGVVKDRGCGAHTTVQKATNELLRAGMIEKTEQGGRHRPSLYALTWRAVDDCGTRASFSPTRTPSGSWKDSQASVTPPRSLSQSPEIEKPYPGNSQSLPAKQADWPILGCAS